MRMENGEWKSGRVTVNGNKRTHKDNKNIVGKLFWLWGSDV